MSQEKERGKFGGYTRSCWNGYSMNNVKKKNGSPTSLEAIHFILGTFKTR